jgi:hypothetical protein
VTLGIGGISLDETQSTPLLPGRGNYLHGHHGKAEPRCRRTPAQARAEPHDTAYRVTVRKMIDALLREGLMLRL